MAADPIRIACRLALLLVAAVSVARADTSASRIAIALQAQHWTGDLDGKVQRRIIRREAPGHFETEDILEMANAGLVKMVVSDRYIADLWHPVFANIEVRPDLIVHEDGDIAFAIRKNSPRLKAALDGFTRTHGEGREFGNVTSTGC